MKGATLFIEIHGWRGVGIIGGPLCSVLCLGFISFGFMPRLLTEWLRSRLNGLKNAVKGSSVPPRAEMSAWDPNRPLHIVRTHK